MDDPNTTTTDTNAVIVGGGGGGRLMEMSKSERHVWLMKCPPMVSRSLHHPSTTTTHRSSSSSAETVAKVIVSVDPLLPNHNFSSTQFTMELAGTESGNIPKRYSMDMSTDFIPMSVFSESSQGRLSVEGKIYHKFDMKPHNENIDEYRKLCRERTNKYMTRTRQIQVINDDNGRRMRPMPGMVCSKASGPCALMDKKKLPVKGSDLKRTRRDREEMEQIMFKLFERQSNWSLKQLIQETDQPEQFLKDILKVLCVYNNKGANQGTYEIKPEYKRSGEQPDSS